MYYKRMSLPLKIIRGNGAVPRLEIHLFKTEVFTGSTGLMKKGYKVEDSQDRSLILTLKQLAHLQSYKTTNTLLSFSCYKYKLYLKGQSRKHFFSNGRLHDISEQRLLSLHLFLVVLTFPLAARRLNMKTRNLNRNQQVSCSI